MSGNSGIAPLITVLIVTGGRNPRASLEQSIAHNRRDDVEWLVVDTGDVPLEPVGELHGVAVRWLSGPVGDGHAAFNRGVAAALGALVLPLYAGDELYPAAISRLINEWRTIPAPRSARFSGVTALMATPSAGGGAPASDPLPFESADIEPAALRYDRQWQGTPLFAMRVELLRGRPLPSPGDALPPLGMVWRAGGRGFLTRAVNAELAVRTEVPPPSPYGDRLDAAAKLTFDGAWRRSHPGEFIAAARDYQRASARLGIPRRRQFRSLSTRQGKAFWLLALAARDKRRSPTQSNKAHPAQSSGAFPGPVVLLSRTLEPSGPERLLAALAIGLRKRGIDTRVVSFYGGTIERDLHEGNVPHEIMEKRGRWDVSRFASRLNSELRRIRPAVVLGFEPDSTIAALLLRRFHRGTVVGKLSLGSESRLARFGPRFSRSVPLLIATSESEKRAAIAAGFPAAKIVVVREGIDLAHLRRDEEARSRLRGVWRVPEQAPLIGRAGRIDAEYDYPTFLRAAALIHRRYPEARFVCIGGGPNALVDEMKRLGNELGIGSRVIWTGPIQVMASAYSAMDVCVSSSSSGVGVPRSVVEAMACGTPAVATDVGDAAWALGDDRFLVPPSDERAMADAIARLLDDFAADLVDGAALRARIDRELSIEHYVDQMELALRSVS